MSLPGSTRRVSSPPFRDLKIVGAPMVLIYVRCVRLDVLLENPELNTYRLPMFNFVVDLIPAFQDAGLETAWRPPRDALGMSFKDVGIYSF